jgi:hypothetical protein
MFLIESWELLIRGLSSGVLGILARIKPKNIFWFNNLLNPKLLESKEAGLILRKYSNLYTIALNMAFIWIQASGNYITKSEIFSNLARVYNYIRKEFLLISLLIYLITIKIPREI